MTFRSLFKTLTTSSNSSAIVFVGAECTFSCLQLDIATSSDLIGVEARSSGLFARGREPLKNRSAVFALGERINIIKSPDTFIWNTMIRAYLNVPNPQESLSLFFQMRLRWVHTHVVKLGFASDLFVQTALIEMYVKLGTVDVAKNILDEMDQPDMVSFNVLLAECDRIGKVNLARQLFDKMPARDLVSWNTMIHGFATCSDVGTARQLIDMNSERDLSANVRLDRVTMVSVLSACGDLGALGMGKIVHEYRDRSKVEIDVKLGLSQ
ncbi:hypothetical protein IFM89_008362 [Coptis chinensis]|uniref:Vps52 C-terminal domain-containing protein n=1 Tax=Coptis chinensis TaxID=261450 RepID=A0A835IIP6_9MAGN|nr:hypothetical protein IFM89_008362 [Coptis chinensis]